MADFEEESLDLENLESEAHEAEETHLEEGESDAGNRGDINVALRKEREKRREIERERDEARELAARREAMLNAIQPHRQEPQVDRSKVRQQLQADLFERPDEVLMFHNNQVAQGIQRQYAPMFAQQTKYLAAMDPEYGEIYQSPKIRKAVDAYIDNAFNQGKMVAPEELKSVMKYFADIVSDFNSGNLKPSTAGKEKLSSAVNKGGSTPSTNSSASDEEVFAKALKLPPKDYAKWEKEPKNRALVQRVLNKAN